MKLTIIDDWSNIPSILKESCTKERILDSATAIMLEHGFHAVGINALLASVNIPKGSFYHWFQSKEHLGCEMIRHYSESENAYIQKTLEDTNSHKNPADRIISLLQAIITKFKENGYKCPCLLLKLSGEISNFSERMRDELAKSLKDTTRLFKAALDEAIQQGFLNQNLDTSLEAEFILDYWTGSLHRSTMNRDDKSLHTAIALFQQRMSS